MATINPQLPTLQGAARAFATLSAADAVPLLPSSRYFLHWKNTTAGPLTAVIDDPTSQLPAGGGGAQATFADVSVGPVPATTGEFYQEIPSDRFRDANGNMNITGATGMQLSVVGPL